MKMIEIRWHGRGGQGGVTSAELLAKAAYIDGYKGVQAFPYFGAERRGAPVKAFTRIADKEINVRSQIYTPDIVAVLDASILDLTDVTEGLIENGKVIINTPKKPDEISLPKGHIYTYDGTGIALKNGLLVGGLHPTPLRDLIAHVEAHGGWGALQPTGRKRSSTAQGGPRRSDHGGGGAAEAQRL